MRERILIRNADAVVTCDPADRVLYNSDILICGNRIEAVGSNLAAGDAPRSLTPQASMFTPALLIHTIIFSRHLFAI